MTNPDKQKQEFHIEITFNDKTALDYLATESGLSRQKIKTVRPTMILSEMNGILQEFNTFVHRTTYNLYMNDGYFSKN